MGSTRRNESRESDSRAPVALRQYVKELGRRPMHIYICGLTLAERTDRPADAGGSRARHDAPDHAESIATFTP